MRKNHNFFRKDFFSEIFGLGRTQPNNFGLGWRCLAQWTAHSPLFTYSHVTWTVHSPLFMQNSGGRGWRRRKGGGREADMWLLAVLLVALRWAAWPVILLCFSVFSFCLFLSGYLFFFCFYSASCLAYVSFSDLFVPLCFFFFVSFFYFLVLSLSLYFVLLF